MLFKLKDCKVNFHSSTHWWAPLCPSLPFPAPEQGVGVKGAPSPCPQCPQHTLLSSACPCLTARHSPGWKSPGNQLTITQPSPATPTPSPPLPLQLLETISWARPEDPDTFLISWASRSLYWFHVSWNLRTSGN